MAGIPAGLIEVTNETSLPMGNKALDNYQSRRGAIPACELIGALVCFVRGCLRKEQESDA